MRAEELMAELPRPDEGAPDENGLYNWQKVLVAAYDLAGGPDAEVHVAELPLIEESHSRYLSDCVEKGFMEKVNPGLSDGRYRLTADGVVEAERICDSLE